MRRLVVAAALGLVASLLLVGAARAALTLERQSISVAHLVEQQSPPECFTDENGPLCVVNPTGCPWDIDDSFVWWALPDTLPPGSVSFGQCLIRDNTHRMLGGIVHSKSPDLVVTIDYQPIDVSFTLTRVAVDRAYEYRGCVFGPRYSDPSAGQPIPGSNGGWGVPTTVTVTITNPTPRNVRNVDAKFESGVSTTARRAAYCIGEEGPVFVLNGASWQTAL